MDQENTFESRIDLSELKNKIDQIRAEIANILVGQQEMVDLLLTAMLADGHVLIEGVPGIAKTLSAKIVAKLIEADFRRIQFTPDLMPSDILGTNVFNVKNSEFEFRKGPLFGNIVLIDEINRAPAKTQSALFEVMEERQVSIDGKTFPFEPVYMILATQNPIEQEGTYRLPEAQLDRFLFKLVINYPELDDEVQILTRHHENKKFDKLTDLKSVIGKSTIEYLREKVGQVYVSENLLRYIAQLVTNTRNSPAIYLGASPRASISILNASKAYAALQGRDFVIPEDIQKVYAPVINHRIILTPEAEMEGLNVFQVCKRLIDKVEVPR